MQATTSSVSLGTSQAQDHSLAPALPPHVDEIPCTNGLVWPEAIVDGSHLPLNLMPIVNAWVFRAAVEMEEQGPVAYVDVWFIHHVSASSCFVPRTVLFGFGDYLMDAENPRSVGRPA